MRRTVQRSAAGHGHAPLHQVVDAGAPAHGEFAARVFSDIAAQGAGPGAGGIGGKDQAVFRGVLHRLFGDDSGFGLHDMRGRGAAIVELKLALADGANVIELLGVHHDAAGAQRHRAAGQSGAGSARNHFESEACDGQQQRRHLLLHRPA